MLNNNNQMVIQFIFILCLSSSLSISLLSMFVANSCEAYYLPMKYNLDHDLIDYLTNINELKYYPRQIRSFYSREELVHYLNHMLQEEEASMNKLPISPLRFG
ncbi:hypothetical protein Smp_176400 [Schistosoma mansoni]|uniref:Uncharacterized protein n=1 Tax=Schistosoma mansoni TaxID=6183 RepID=A0A5K4F9U2_SCHMA|nr:hypothetical protein Smp_176400 [Schistosoma mansoni]|eukprot:XP_018647256.1 hypothetical protein Smp_176400 [Schistosoma mansoni]